MSNMPNKLCLKDGVLAMQDGSDVNEYLRSRTLLKDQPEVVLLSRDLAVRLSEEAYKYRLSHLSEDERFVIAG